MCPLLVIKWIQKWCTSLQQLKTKESYFRGSHWETRYDIWRKRIPFCTTQTIPYKNQGNWKWRGRIKSSDGHGYNVYSDDIRRGHQTLLKSQDSGNDQIFQRAWWSGGTSKTCGNTHGTVTFNIKKTSVELCEFDNSKVIWKSEG